MIKNIFGIFFIKYILFIVYLESLVNFIDSIEMIICLYSNTLFVIYFRKASQKLLRNLINLLNIIVKENHFMHKLNILLLRNIIKFHFNKNRIPINFSNVV